ncbi:FYVE, RhoGEF and PH domain-containing protein 6-like [Odontesthes bonariensis]|uniref:FYVE, RhoGEF and PH domain-containing protein 6-like n=1 Tax=Odontesthes bonariensis TaxID=219752 RepID=UPI003F586865
MNSVMQKPPVAPKPKLTLYQRPVLSPPISRRDGLPHPSPGTERRVKPALAPKPCLSKVPAAVKSKPLISKSHHHTPVSETPRTVGPLNSQNGIWRENKKPDWDYIIPICLCSQENCTCIRNTSLEKMGKDSKISLNKSKHEENGKTVSTSLRMFDNRRGNAGNVKCQAMNSSSTDTHAANLKPLHETLTLDKNLNANSVDSSPEMTVRSSLPHRTLNDDTHAKAILHNIPGLEPDDDGLCTEGTIVPQPKPVPAAPRKSLPVPVPRKPKTAVLAHQEKVEEEKEEKEEIAVQEGREVNAKEVNMSSDGKGSSSLSVSVPDSENKQPVILSARGACAPPAPPPRKKPFLSELKRTVSFAPQTPLKDVQEEDLGWDTGVYEMEISVDREDEDMQREGADDLEGADCHRTHYLSPSSSLSQLVTVAVAAEETGTVKATPKELQKHISPVTLVQSKEQERKVDRLNDYGTEQVNHLQKGFLKNSITRELPLPPNDKSSSNLLKSGNIKPSRSNLCKKKAKSFSTADLIRSDGHKKNSFRKLLELKLGVKMLPKRKVKRSQSPDSTVNAYEQDAHKGQYEHPLEHVSTERKLSCPLIGIEQSVDGDDFFAEQTDDYETISDYDEMPIYENVGKGGLSPPASFSQPWQSSLYDDEGIYEEQEPYMSLVKNTPQCQTPTEYDRSSVDEEVAPMNEPSWDDDVVANSTDEEDEDDSSSVSSKGNPEAPEESTGQGEQKKSKIHHIATEIMSSERVFVDVLKLLNVDFRDSVSKASCQSGKPVIEERLLNQILYYLPQLYELNQDLLRELQQRVAKWDESSQLSDIFLKKGPYLKMYSTYIREFDKNVALLEEQTRKNSAFGAVVREFEASPRCANLALKHYLLKPVQRIPQYQLLLTDYLKNLSEDSNDYKDTQAALALVKEVANHANDIMKQGDNFQKLIQVQCRLNGHHEIVQPGRIFLKEGVLMKLSRKVMQPRMFFLFNDTLLYTIPVQSGQFKLKNMLSLAGMKVSKPSQEAYQNELNIESVERSFILSASSATERDGWLEAISTAISDYTKKKISFISGKPPEEIELNDYTDGAPLGSKAPIWIPDPRTTMCMICTCEFTLTWRRHHCRACGKVVCQSCSSNKHRLEYLKNQLARVCDQCFLILHTQKSEMASLAALSPGNRATFTFPRRQKKIPAALKEVTANTDNYAMSGYLQRSKHDKKQGKRLWFVIKDKVLYTYAASEDVAALESQPLLGFVLKVDPSQKLQFKLYHKKTLHYIFTADDVQTAQRWIESFKEATVL